MRIIAILSTSILIFLSFPTYDVWVLKGYTFFAWFSLVPLILYLKGKSLKEVYIVSFFTGLISSFLVFGWIGHFASKIPGGYTLIVVLLIPFLSVIFAVRFLLAELLSKKFNNLRFFIYPALWISIDWVQSIGFLAWPFTYWGHSQYKFTSFIQVSSFTGIMGINFILILSNSIIAELMGQWNEVDKNFTKLFRSLQFKKFIALILIVVSSVVYGKIILAKNDKKIKKELRVSIIQACISPWENWRLNRFKYLNESKRYTEQSLKENPDFIIWSESATLELISYRYSKGESSRFDKEVLDFVKKINRPLLTGEIGIFESRKGLEINRQAQNNAVLINRNGEVVKTYPKINLVPFGEWFPYEKWFPAVKRIASKYGGSDFLPGKGPMLFDIMNKKFAALICFEGIFFRLCREYKNMGADFLINVTNDGWTDKYSGHIQHFSTSIFRAIENGLWFVRAGNTGKSAIIDPYGRVKKSTPILKQGYLTGDLDFSLNHETFYSRNGDLFFYLVMVFLVVILIFNVYYKFTDNS